MFTIEPIEPFGTGEYGGRGFPCLVRGPVFADERGSFFHVARSYGSDDWPSLEETYSGNGLTKDEVADMAIYINACIHCSIAFVTSRAHVLRGLHYQQDMCKLIRCVAGNVVDAIVDIRPDSPTYGRHKLFELGPGRRGELYDCSLFVPEGFAHGAYSQTSSVMLYGLSMPQDRTREGAIYALDPTLGIDWGCRRSGVIMSVSDQRAPFFSQHNDKGAK